MNKIYKNTIGNKWRIYLIFLIYFFISLIIIAQLYRVQIVQGESYSKKAENQHIRPSSNIFDRGSIYFSDKNGKKSSSAATLKTGYKIAIKPNIIKNPEDVYNNISFYLDLDEEFYLSRANKQKDPHEEIAKRVPHEIGKKIIDLNMGGVYVEKENWRFYPSKDLASQVLGFVAYSSDEELSGRYGLEKEYNSVLEKNEKNVFSNFFVEIFSSANNLVEKNKTSKGSLITTINPDVQSFVQEEIRNTAEKWGSKKIGAIVMNPQNGEIISMALEPTFDLNEFNMVDDSTIYSNNLVESVYEMGSIVKPLTVAVGLDTGSITAETTYDDLGSISMSGYTIYNYDKKARGVVNMQEVLNKSLNTGVSFIVSKVGNQKFGDYMKKLIGSKTKIDLPNEAAPLVSNLDSDRNLEHATASFGQGIAMNPISITRALASLGNGGKLVWPHLVKEIETELGFSKKTPIPEPIQVFKPETSEEISRMLVNVVDEALRGGTAYLKSYSIAAKTGTAQIPSPEGGYYEDKFLHSFFGYFPAYDPEFIVFLYHVEPQGALYASETLTDPFMKITKFLINNYDIKPDRNYEKNI